MCIGLGAAWLATSMLRDIIDEVGNGRMMSRDMQTSFALAAGMAVFFLLAGYGLVLRGERHQRLFGAVVLCVLGTLSLFVGVAAAIAGVLAGTYAWLAGSVPCALVAWRFFRKAGVLPDRPKLPT